MPVVCDVSEPGQIRNMFARLDRELGRIDVLGNVAGKGSIINITSIAGIRALGRNHTPYSMAMGGTAQMTRELSTEWASRGVRVNSIVLAQVMNPGMQQRVDREPRLEQQWLRGIAMGRLGTPEDIKGVAIFLAADASSWVTGALLPLDGGNQAMNAGASYPGGPGITA